MPAGHLIGSCRIRGLGQQVKVGAYDSQRRAQLVGDDRDQLRPRLVDAAQAVELRLRLQVKAATVDDPGEQRRDRRQPPDLGVVEVTVCLGLDVEDADHAIGDLQRHRQDGREALVIDAANPGAARVVRKVGADHRTTGAGGESGDALTDLEARHADVLAIHPVGGGERQAGAITVDEVERADLRAHGAGAAIDDQLHQVVPGRCAGRELHDLAQRPELGCARGGGVGGLARGRHLIMLTTCCADASEASDRHLVHDLVDARHVSNDAQNLVERLDRLDLALHPDAPPADGDADAFAGRDVRRAQRLDHVRLELAVARQAAVVQLNVVLALELVGVRLVARTLRSVGGTYGTPSALATR